MSRLMRSWNIFKASFQVIYCQKKLLLFPAISFSATIFLFILILGGGAGILSICGINVIDALQQTGNSSSSEKTMGIIGFIAFALLYFFSITLANFFNAAFYSEINLVLHGEDVSIGRGFRFSFSRFKAILLWSLVAASVGIIIKSLEERMGWLGTIILRIIGLAWAVTTIFAIPVLVHDHEVNNPFKVLKRSAAAIKQTWGESLTGFMGLGIITGMSVLFFGLYSIGGIIIAAIIGNQVIFVLMLISIPIGLFLVLALGYTVGVAEKVYISLLYVYASEKAIPEGFDEEYLQNPWKKKK